MTSASPCWISRVASPIAWAPVEHAVTTAWFGPLKPKRMETRPDAKLIRVAGMKCGLSRRGPRFSTKIAASAIVLRPPMPEPIITPVRSRDSSSSGSHPESFTASVAAAIAKTIKSSILRCSAGATQSSGRNAWGSPSRGNWAATWQASPEISKPTTRPIPDSALRSRSQVAFTPHASGVTMPRPVIATRLMKPAIRCSEKRPDGPLRPYARDQACSSM